MAYNDEYRERIAALVKDSDFLTLIREAKSDDDRFEIIGERFAAKDIRAKIENFQTLPAGMGGGYRVTFILWGQGAAEFVDFGQE